MEFVYIYMCKKREILTYIPLNLNTKALVCTSTHTHPPLSVQMATVLPVAVFMML